MRPDIKVALITGAGTGIGRALALNAAGRGIKLLLVGRRPEPLEETKELIGERVFTETLPADMTVAADRKAVLSEVASLFGRLDYLVNNAGSVSVGRFERLNEEDMTRLFAVNVVAPAMLIREALPLLKQAGVNGTGPGRIVNVGSMFGEIAFPRFSGYSASKFALRGLSDGLRRELAPDGIGITYAAPRATRTPAAGRFESLAEPMGMKFDSPERVAQTIWNAAIKGRSRVYPGLGERMAAIAQSLFPAGPDSHIAGLERKLRSTGDEPIAEDAGQPLRIFPD